MAAGTQPKRSEIGASREAKGSVGSAHHIFQIEEVQPMKLNYNVTGSERKSLVSTIGIVLNAPTKFLGAPTFAYEVGGYRISPNGTLTGEDNGVLEIKLLEAGFDATKRYYDGEFPFVNGVDGVDQPKDEADSN
jgi:hypothetical protein